MLAIPTTGFARSVKNHNVRLDALCDWIEGSVLFDEPEVSQLDVVDVLLEEAIYDEQDLAHEMILNVWTELRRRDMWIGGKSAFRVEREWIRRVVDWRRVSPQAFLVLLSLAPLYDWWKKEFGQDYAEQGELFELLTKESLQAQFSDWSIHQTGWSRTRTEGLKGVVQTVADCLGEPVGDLALWDTRNAKELGLDLLCYRPFADERVGIPVFLMQCASGGNWQSKRKTPDIDAWCDLIRFKNNVVRGFAAPFALLDEEFARSTVHVKGLLLDRCRLLSAFHHSKDWTSADLESRLLKWIEKRAAILISKSK